MLRSFLICLFLGLSSGHKQSSVEENTCFSRFDYEYKVIQKLVMLAEGQDKLEKTMKEQLAEANARQTEMAKTIHTQKERINEAYAQQQAMNQTIETQNGQLAAADERQKALEKALQDLRGQSTTGQSVEKGSQVAFSVRRLKSLVAGSSSGTPTFDYTVVNTGSFDMTTGLFTCPVAGYYLFTFSMERDDNSSGSAECYIQINTDRPVYAQTKGSAHESASVSVVYHLAVKDKVNMHCTGWQNLEKGGSNSVFTGILISPD